MLLIRKIHLCLGIFFAPTIVFFAVSGALQTLGLHEAEDASSVQPPRWIAAIASIHREQHLPHPALEKMPGALSQMRAGHERDTNHEQDAGPDAGVAAPDAEAGPGQTLLKAFVVLMAAGLTASAGLGICIAIGNMRTRRLAGLMLALGILLPAATLLL